VNLDIDLDLRKKWKEMLDSLAELLDVPVALIMRIDGQEIEVFQKDSGDQNPYEVGDREHLKDSGLYCEWVIRERKRLLVPNALNDKLWDSNPDLKLGLVSYLGFPVHLPDNTIFGTLCVLDRKENTYSGVVEKVLHNYRDLLESQLLLLHQQQKLMKTLRGILPICGGCKRIRDESGYWHPLEEYISARSNADFSHGVCPDCLDIYS
jgi:GAF domain-containing protein